MANNNADLKVRFDAEWDQMQRATTQIQRELDKTARAAQRTDLAMAGLQKNLDDEAAAQWDRQASAMDSAGRAMLGFGAAAALGLGYAAKAAIDWESAWAGVTKTVDGSSRELDRLEGSLRGIATSMPASHQEIAAVAEAAGQLGVKAGNIAEFTKTMIMLGTTTNLSAEDAANGLARFSNVMGTSQKDVDRLGSSLVALGNDGASTEAEILEMAQRISGAGKQLDLTEPQVLGMASALASVGIKAEAGGSSMSTLLVNIQDAVSKGGSDLETFAKVAGVSADQFRKKFGEDAAGAFNMFIKGLGRIKAGGGDTLAVLRNLGITEIRQRDAVLRLAGAGDLLSKSLRTGNRSWKDNSALLREAQKRYETTESKAKIAFNTFKDGAIDIGNVLIPAISDVVTTGRDMLTFFNNLPGPVKKVVTIAGVAATGFALVGGAALIAAPKVVAFKAAVDGLSAGPLRSAGRGLSRFAGIMTGPWGAAIGIGLTALGFYAAKQGATQAEIEEVTSTLNEQSGAITENTRKWVASKIADELGDVASEAEKAGISLENLAKASIGDPDALDEIIEKREHLYQLSIENRSQGQPYGDLTQDQIDQLKALQKVIDVVEDSSGVVGKARARWETTTAVEKAFGDEASKTADKQKGANKAWGEGADAAEALGGEVETLADQFEDLTGATLDEREAKRQWFSALRDVNEALKENGRTLDEHTEKGADNQEKIDALVEASQDWLAQQDRIGTSARGVKKGFDRQHEAIVQALVDFGKTRKQAETTADKLHKLPADWKLKIKQEGANRTRADIKEVDDAARAVTNYEEIGLAAPRANKVADQLRDVDDAERHIVDRHEIQMLAPRADKVWGQLHDLDRAESDLADRHDIDMDAPGAEKVRGQLQGVDRDIRAIDGKNVDITLSAKAKNVLNAADKVWSQLGFNNADGSITEYYANGDIRNGHTAQIAPAGAWRVWAEEETGGEAYIPLAPSKRQRSVNIWEETGRRLGAFADGGITLDTRTNGHPRKDVRDIDGMFGRLSESLSEGYSQAFSKMFEQLQVGFHWPLPRKFGPSGSWGSYASGGSHPALDWPAPLGTPIFSTLPGRVADVQHLDTSYGNHVRINHGHGLESISGHMERTAARVGANVMPGSTIGYVDSTGNSTGNHLHLGFRRNGTPIDYTPWLHGGGPMGIGMPLGIYDGNHKGLDRAGPDMSKAYARGAMQHWGWGPAQWAPLDSLWTRESGWRWYADNPSSSAYGIPQSLPGSKMASAGGDWRTNSGTQVDWGLGYIHDRYDSPARAWAHSEATNWYKDGGIRVFDRGGAWPSGTLGVNLSGHTEYVNDPQATAAAAHMANGGLIDGFGFGQGNSQGPRKRLGSTSGESFVAINVVPGAVRSFKDLLELVSKPDVVHTSRDLNKAWRNMAREARDLDREERQLRRTRRHAKVTNKQLKESERALEEAKKRDERATNHVSNMEDRLAQLRRDAGPKVREVAKAEKELIRIQEKAGKNGKASKAEQKKITAAEDELRRARQKAGGETKKIRAMEARLNKAREDETVTGAQLHRIRDKLRAQRQRAKDAGKAATKQEKEVEQQRNKLAKATERWKNMQAELLEQAKAVAESITSAGAVFGGAGTSNTAQGLLSKLSGAGSDAGAYGRLLKRVKGRGVDEAILDQILDQGQTPESLALLRSLSNAPNSLIRQINRQQDRLEDIANRVGTWSITPRRHQGKPNARRDGDGHPGLGRVINNNFNGPIHTVDTKAMAREVEKRQRLGLLVAQGA